MSYYTKINSLWWWNMDIRIRLLQLCQQNNITPTKLAEMSCLTQSTVNNITSGRNKSVTVNTLEQICYGLGIKLSDFFVEENNE